MLQTITSGAVSLLVYVLILTSLASESYSLYESNRVRRQSQNEEKAGCALPPPQQNGKFSPSKRRCPPDNDISLCQMTPGNLVPHNWPLFHSCDSGYALNTTKTASVCLDGQWRPALPGCVRLCPPLKDQELRLRCVYREREVSCDSDMRPGTVAGAACPQYYRTSSEKLCLDDGSWTTLNRSAYIETQIVPGNTNFTGFRCVPECGLSSRKDDSTVEVTSPSEFPWVAKIYLRENKTTYREVCVGSLVTTQYVITAAHCIYSSKEEDLRVGLGKIHSDFFKVEIGSSVILEVEKKIVPDAYTGDNFRVSPMDAALMKLLIDTQVTANVMPICLDWNQIYPPATNSTVTVAAWTKSEVTNIWSNTIKPLKYIFVRNTDCKKTVKPFLRNEIHRDRSCLEYTEGLSERPISGAGTTYKVEERHFLIGFVTNKLHGDRKVVLTTDFTQEVLSEWVKENII